MNAKKIIEDALKLSNKRINLCKIAKPCPVCYSNQVQLVDWIDEVLWKCRKCKFKWSNNNIEATE